MIIKINKKKLIIGKIYNNKIAVIMLNKLNLYLQIIKKL